MRLGVGGLQNGFGSRAGKNHLDLCFGVGRLPTPSAVAGQVASQMTLSGWGLGASKMILARLEKSFGLCVLWSEDFPRHLRLWVGPPKLFLQGPGNQLDFVFWGQRTSHSICGWGSCSFPPDFMRLGVGGLQNGFGSRAGKNHLDLCFGVGRLPTPSAVAGQVASQMTLSGWGLGASKMILARLEKSFGLCVLWSEDFPRHLRLWVGPPKLFLQGPGNQLDFVFWGQRTSHSICGWGSCSFPPDFMRLGVGGLQNDFGSRAGKIIWTLCAGVRRLPRHLRFWVR